MKESIKILEGLAENLGGKIKRLNEEIVYASNEVDNRGKELQECVEKLEDINATLKILTKGENNETSVKIIGGKRCCGKTSTLLKRSAEEGHRILVANNNQGHLLIRHSKDLGLSIPAPVSIERLLKDEGFKGSSLLVDEVEMILSKITGCKIMSMSTSATMIEMEVLEKFKERF